jgi:hypothetical protein
MPSRTYVSIDYVTDDAFLLIQLNNDGTIEYAYVYTLDENDNKVSVYGEIFPEKYLEVGNESVTQRSDGSAWYESERRTLLVVLPDGTKTTDLTYVPTFGNMAYSAINDALICLRASLKDAGLPIDLTDFGFTNTQTIGSVERSLDLYA